MWLVAGLAFGLAAIFYLVLQPTIPLLYLALAAMAALALVDKRVPALGDAKLYAIMIVACVIVMVMVLPFAVDMERHLTRGAKTLGYGLLALFLYRVSSTQFVQRSFVASGGLIQAVLLALTLYMALALYEYVLGPTLGHLRPRLPFPVSDWSPVEFNRGMTAAACLAFPLMRLLVHRRQWTWVAMLLALFAAIFFTTPSQTTQLVILLGLVGLMLPARLVVGACMLAFASFLALATASNIILPWVDTMIQSAPVPPALYGAINARSAIWAFFAEVMRDEGLRGWLGLGFQSARALVPLLEATTGIEAVPHAAAHPHNAAQQLLLDLGIAGLVLAALVFVGLARWIRRQQPDEAAIYGLFLVLALATSTVSHDLWHDWWWSFLALGAFLAPVGAQAFRFHQSP